MSIANAPRYEVPIVDLSTGHISREWYKFLVQLAQSVGPSPTNTDDTVIQLNADVASVESTALSAVKATSDALSAALLLQPPDRPSVAPVIAGGTGISGYTQGDLLYASGPTTLAKLADVASGSYLRSGGVSTAPAWSTTTLPNTAALGDVWYGSASNVVSSLSGNTTTTKKFLTQTGDGTNSAVPAWGSIAASDLPGSFSGFANPTAKVGLAAVNGSATTTMRSDASPPLDVGISPTWTGNHVFSAASGNALTVVGTAAGTAVIRANTQATTGTQTASFSATNKPGAASGSPQKWLPVNADGTTYYVPLFS